MIKACRSRCYMGNQNANIRCDKPIDKIKGRGSWLKLADDHGVLIWLLFNQNINNRCDNPINKIKGRRSLLKVANQGFIGIV